ncbi:hypothetical protein F4778DRAFT_780583 [Xylariomycetidae sp. FL2044]|nr:hypothetical protein F4778DRAFT_780583 [Xylariomycetidae sp. FL2044]
MSENALLIVGVVLGVLAIVSVTARFYVRYFKRSGYKWDDWFIMLSILAMIVTDAVDVYAISFNPEGPQTATIETQTTEYSEADQLYTKLTWSLTVTYFLTRDASSPDIALGVLILCYWLGCTIADITNCIPIAYTWLNSLADPRYCFNYNHYWFAAGITEVCIDVLIILLPIRVVLGLQLNKKQRFAVLFVFALGIL